MQLSQNKHNTNFPGRTKAQVGRFVTLTLDLILGLRHFKGKAAELLLEISMAIPWEKVETNTKEISLIEQRHKGAGW